MTTDNSTYHTLRAWCPDCRGRDGTPRRDTGNIGRIQMGHQMYHSIGGPTAACIEQSLQGSERP